MLAQIKPYVTCDGFLREMQILQNSRKQYVTCDGFIKEMQ